MSAVGGIDPAPLDTVIELALAARRLVGVVVLVARDGQLVYHRAAGDADREMRRPMTEDAVFRLASLTKPIVSTATLALADRGLLTLDDPVRRWLPAFRPRTARGREPEITIQHLLTHTAGLTYGFMQPGGDYDVAGVSDGLDAPGITLDENLRRIASVRLSYDPGSAWGYSIAHDVLGAVVAEAGGAPLPEIVAALVALPLGMRGTGFVARDPSRLVTPYADGDPLPVRMTDPYSLAYPRWGAIVRFSPDRALSARAYPSGGSGMVGTAADFLAFLEALRRRDETLLRPESAVALTTHAVGTLRSNPGWGWGFAGAVLLDPIEARTPQTAGTIMWGGAYGHSWFVDPHRRLTVVALTNTAMEGMATAGTFPDELRDAVYAASPITGAERRDR